MEIADILSPQAVFHRLKAANKKKLIAELPGVTWAAPDLILNLRLNYAPNDPLFVDNGSAR